MLACVSMTVEKKRELANHANRVAVHCWIPDLSMLIVAMLFPVCKGRCLT